MKLGELRTLLEESLEHDYNYILNALTALVSTMIQSNLMSEEDVKETMAGFNAYIAQNEGKRKLARMEVKGNG